MTGDKLIDFIARLQNFPDLLNKFKLIEYQMSLKDGKAKVHLLRNTDLPNVHWLVLVSKAL